MPAAFIGTGASNSTRSEQSMTKRAVILGLVISAAIAVVTPYSDLVMQGTWVGLTAFPISAFFFLLVLVLGLNVLLRAARIGLTQAELLVVYTMALVAAGIPSFGLIGLLIPYMAGPFYFASPENKWEERLWPNLPDWLHPEPGVAVTGLYEGLRPGVPIPWQQWLVPLASWAVLVLAVYVVFFCLSALLRQRWVDDEKLVFPLIQLPVEMCRYEPQDRLVPGFFRSPIMWWFFAIPFVIHAINGLHHYYPTMPGINVHRIALDVYLKDRPWSAMSPLWLRFLFSIIGLAYLLPAELSFSLWFFMLFFLIQQVIGSALGAPMPAVQAYPVRQFVAHQMAGGILTSFVLGAVAARPRIEEIWLAVIGRTSHHRHGQADGRAEALPYPVAFWGAVGGLAVICLWGSVAGAGVAKTLVIFVLFLMMHVVAVRLVCEGGMLYVQHPLRPLNIMLAAVGTRGLGAGPIAILSLFDHLFMLDNRSPLMPGIMQGLRIADDGGIRRRSLFGAMGSAVLVAMVISCAVYLSLMYVHGGTKLNTWFTTYYTKNLYSTWTTHLIADGEPSTPIAFLTMAAGVASMGFISFMHRTYLWWPLHPIGYLMGASWPMINFWFPVLLGWLIKCTVLRFGGHKVYKRLLPGFLGLIFGEFASAGMWLVIDLITGVRGHQIFSF